MRLTTDPLEGADGADVLYTDVWTSMGQEEEREQRLLDLERFSLDGELLSIASREAVAMHCLPAHVGEEITEDVLYGPRSLVWDQAENRLHTQKAVHGARDPVGGPANRCWSWPIVGDTMLADVTAVTHRAPVRIGLALLLLTGVAVPAAIAAGRSASTFTVDKAVVTASWNEGFLKPGAGVTFSGNVDGPSNLNASLRPLAHPGTVTARAEFSAPAGAFNETLKLPNRPLPGKYRLRVAGTTGTTVLAPVDVIVTVPAPPEGIVDRLQVGTSRSGPFGGRVVSGTHAVLWARYLFISPPTGKKVQLVWSQTSHRIVGKVVKRDATSILLSVGSGQPLRKGRWITVLTIDGRVAMKTAVTLV